MDSAVTLTTATSAAVVATHRAALIGKARVLVDQGSYAAAAALVSASAVPTSYQYLLTFDQTSGDNQIWALNISQARYTVGDSADAAGVIGNALPFASSKDPRVPTIASAGAASDGTPLFVQQIWKNRNDPVPLVSGIDARLIEAEAALNANDFAGMTATLNALRATSQTIGTYVVGTMPALNAIPTTRDAAVTLFFREKAFWSFGRGQRLPDSRRMVRQYGRAQSQAFPTGRFFKSPGDTYKSDVNFPVPDGELTNPNFKGCIDRSA
jgi:starch-binding outer membrane protein, SusD/RagB family